MTHEIFAEAVVLPHPDEGLEVAPATLRLDGHTITHVFRHRTEQAVEVQGLVAPAFVNAHTHLSMSAFRGIGGLAVMRGNVVEDLYYRLESTLTAEDVGAFTAMGIAESLLAGVGTVWDHYYFGDTVADVCRKAGITAVITPTLQDLEGPGVRQLEQQLDATVRIHQDAKLLEAGVVAGLGPHATDTVSARLWKRIADLAEKHRLPLHAHAAQSIEEFDRAQERHGTTPISWLRREGWLEAAPSAMLVHALYANRADLEGLDPAHTALAFCPASQIQYCFPAHTRGWRELGQRVVIGTDAGACNDGLNLQQELRLTASGPLFGLASDPAFTSFWNGEPAAADAVSRRRNQLNRESEVQPAELLQMILERPGTLHPTLKVGAVAPGFRANLVSYDLDHPCFWPGSDPLRALALQDVAPAIRRMMVNGHWLSDDRDHQRAVLSSDWLADARSEARHRLPRFLNM